RIWHKLAARRGFARICTPTAGLGRALAISGHVTQSPLTHPATARVQTRAPGISSATTGTTDWRQALPTLTGQLVTLRQLEIADAPALLAVMSCARVPRFIATPPPRLDGFQRFIERMRGEQARGAYACFAVVP